MAPRAARHSTRRWWTLGVLSVALPSSRWTTRFSTLLSDDRARSGRLGGAAAVDRRLLHAGLRWPAAHHGQPRRPLRSPAGAGGRPRRIRRRLAAVGACHERRHADRQPGLHGPRRARSSCPRRLSILTNVFPAEERPKAIGIWAAVAGLGIAIGPVAGGWLIEQFSWGWCSSSTCPSWPSLWRRRRRSCRSRATRGLAARPAGAMLSTAGLGVPTWAIIEAGGERWLDRLATLGGVRRGAAALAAFVGLGAAHARPRCSTFGSSPCAASAGRACRSRWCSSRFGAIFFLTMYLQEVQDYSALEAGLRVTPIAVGLVLGGPVSAKLARRIGNAQRGGRRADVVAGAMLLLATVDARRGLRPDRRIAGADGPRHGRNDGAGHRVDHELAAARPCGRRLGHERHGPDGRRHARRGDPRKPPVQRLRCGHGTGGARAFRRGAGSGRGLDRRRQRRWPSSIGGEAGATLNRVAETAFSSAMGTTLTVAAGVAMAGALVALVVLPGRERERVEKRPCTPKHGGSA